MQLPTLLKRAAWLLALATATQCTPPKSAAPDTAWLVANETLDTLHITIRYPLDSAVLTLAELTESRYDRRADSTAKTRQYGYYEPGLLRRFTRHQGQWYIVQNTQDITYPTHHDSGSAQVPPIDRARGILHYQVPPRSAQPLINTYTIPTDARNDAFIAELSLQDRHLRRALLPGSPLLHLFRPQLTGQEHDYSPRYRCQLTVGPGLTINK